eukprot:15475135-Alexandrium_andersonii.AAC.1
MSSRTPGASSASSTCAPRSATSRLRTSPPCRSSRTSVTCTSPRIEADCGPGSDEESGGMPEARTVRSSRKRPPARIEPWLGRSSGLNSSG